MHVLPLCIHVHHLHSWWSQIPEVGIGSLGTPVTGDCHVGAWNQTWALWKTSNALKLQAISPAPLYSIFFLKFSCRKWLITEGFGEKKKKYVLRLGRLLSREFFDPQTSVWSSEPTLEKRGRHVSCSQCHTEEADRWMPGTYNEKWYPDLSSGLWMYMNTHAHRDAHVHTYKSRF